MSEPILKLQDTEYLGWKSVSIRRSMDTLAGTFDMTVVDDWKNKPFNISPDVIAEIYFGTQKLLTGFVDTIRPEISAGNYQLGVSGRCKTADLVDCSAMNKPGTWSKPISMKNLINALLNPDPVLNYGVKLIVDTALGADIQKFSLNNGESVYDAIRRLCAMRAVLPIATVDGDLIITTTGNSTASGVIEYGVNILEASADYDYKERFSVYTVRGQRKGTTAGSGWASGENSTIAVEGFAIDTAVVRYRPKIITTDGQISTDLADKKAAWEAWVRAGRGATVSVTVQGWTDAAGVLWAPNTLVEVKAVPVGVYGGKMLITECVYTKDGQGTKTTLKLNRPETYAADPTAEVKKKTTTNNRTGWLDGFGK